MPRISTSSARPVAAARGRWMRGNAAPGVRPATRATNASAGCALGAVIEGTSPIAATGLALLVLILGIASAHTAIGAITDARLTFDDPERAASFHAALNVFGHHPIIGAGPSLPTLTWVSESGTSVYRFAHNEYLQVLAELGTIGGLLLAALLLMVVRRLYRALRRNGAVSAAVRGKAVGQPSGAA